MQDMTMDTTHQLVADHRAALHATAGRGRLRRVLSRAIGTSAVALDLAAHESAEVLAPAVIVPGATAAGTTAGARVDKVA